SGRGGGDIPGHARAHEAPRGRGRAGGAVRPDHRASHDRGGARGCRRHRGRRGGAARRSAGLVRMTELDELESAPSEATEHRAAVERIRGVDSDHTLRSLLHRRLVVELGRSNAPGRPILYGTAFEFLERFGLESLDDLPALDADVAARLAEEGGVALLPLDEEMDEAATGA